ncbi:MAG TPA: UDP-N-acetylmuramoyl-L-alanine--D-glutamate ligase [Firmicutes bacterium]|nr:UDP-N-acetylmuramoyl-L-alanine--D-glutamate ligase [Bacillota bacterium]
MNIANAADFFSWLKGKRVAVCGLGNNNPPVVLQFLRYGARVTACDRRSREQLGGTAELLEEAGASLCLGEGYLSSLEECGADLVLRTPGMKPYLPEFEQARRRGVPVTSEMELFLALSPAPVTAVTGSDGKTTTTTLIARLLEASGRRVHLGGNIGRPLLPDILEVRPEDEVVVELSSFQLTGMHRRVDTAVVTNVAPNHLDWHTDMEEYVGAKRNLVREQDAACRAVLNADNAITRGFAADTAAPVYFFSRREKPARGAWLTPDGMLVMTENGVDTPLLPAAEIRLPGMHNVENFLAAACAVWGKAGPEAVADLARRFGGVPHRCELIRERRGVKYYNDSIASSPTRTIAGLRAFREKSPERKNVILIAGGYDKHIPYEPLGPAAAETVKEAVLLGATAEAIQRAIRACSDLPVHRVESMEEAVRTAAAAAREGDVVTLSPASASFDMYRNFEERGDHFRRLVEALDE